METRAEKEAKVLLLPGFSLPCRSWPGGSLDGRSRFRVGSTCRRLLLSLLPNPSVAGPWVLHHPLVGFLNLFTRLLIIPAITPLNEPSVSCQDPRQVNLGEMLGNLQCLLAS